MADENREVRVFSSSFAAALAFLYVAKAYGGATQPKDLRKLLKSRPGARQFTVEEFEKGIGEIAAQVMKAHRTGFDPPQLIDRVPGRNIFIWRPRVSKIIFRFEYSLLEIIGNDEEAKSFRIAIEKLNVDGLEKSEEPPPPDPQADMFDLFGPADDSTKL